MGIKSLSGNKKKALKSRKSERWHRALKAEKKKILPVESVEIENIHLFSKEKLKNKLRNPKNNIKISGKKFRRLTKRLGHNVREKSQMDVEVINTARPEAKDAVMIEANAELPAAAAPSSLPTTAGRKKRRGGKKHKKGSTSAASGGGQVFENNDGWTDVEMKDD
ncbi:unnamed protein product [Candidula unifasciata]|uniref:Uncharacterized protein n=1 Tax=Candidula unifasciata TaxID=100452 RepID=A0A8S4A8J5_9EUPU|nr:unnamed protein product [Candidula unifasciata]